MIFDLSFLEGSNTSHPLGGRCPSSKSESLTVESCPTGESAAYAGEERQFAGCGYRNVNGCDFTKAATQEWELRISRRRSLDTLRRIKNDRSGLPCLSKI